MTSRNEVFDALIGLAAGLTWGANQTFAHTGRRPRLPGKLVGFMPCCMQSEYFDDVTQARGMPQRRVWLAAWLINYQAPDDDSDDPQRYRADMLDAIDRLFPPEVGTDGSIDGIQTLGGLVHSVTIDQKTESYGGNVDSNVLIVVPLKLIIP